MRPGVPFSGQEFPLISTTNIPYHDENLHFRRCWREVRKFDCVGSPRLINQIDGDVYGNGWWSLIHINFISFFNCRCDTFNVFPAHLFSVSCSINMIIYNIFISTSPRPCSHVLFYLINTWTTAVHRGILKRRANDYLTYLLNFFALCCTRFHFDLLANIFHERNKRLQEVMCLQNSFRLRFSALSCDTLKLFKKSF